MEERKAYVASANVPTKAVKEMKKQKEKAMGSLPLRKVLDLLSLGVSN